jgi:hypothetical protein
MIPHASLSETLVYTSVSLRLRWDDGTLDVGSLDGMMGPYM